MRFAIGVGLALLALFIYSALETGAPSWGTSVVETFRPTRAHLAVQVLLDDVAIAILFVRMAAAFGPRRAVIAVAFLFALGHVPTMLASGASCATSGWAS
ncbi:MAG: hypothetical protein ACREJC_02235 [Tepidisphaeraceae bacterium]